MRKKGYRGTRVEKRTLSKSESVCRLYDALQSRFADVLEDCQEVREIRCNVDLDGLQEGEYTSDFVCVKSDGDLMVRECVQRKYLTNIVFRNDALEKSYEEFFKVDMSDISEDEDDDAVLGDDAEMDADSFEDDSEVEAESEDDASNEDDIQEMISEFSNN